MHRPTASPAARGNDTLDGGLGNDTFDGGMGDDVYIVSEGGETLIDSGGNDTVRSKVAWTLAAGFENLELTGGSINGTGNAANNRITGSTGNNLLAGLDGNDTLIGQGGNDTLDGGTGDDSMAGELGNDIYLIDSAGDVVTEAAGEGVDTVKTTLATISLTGGLAEIEKAEALGTADFTATGNSYANTIIGNIGNDSLSGMDGNDTLNSGAGNDTLDGGTGADSMIGGTGDDVYRVDDAGDKIKELAGEGEDKVITTLSSYILATNVENLQGLGSGPFTFSGNALANDIVTSSGNDFISGGARSGQHYGAGRQRYARRRLGARTRSTAGSATTSIMSITSATS